MHRSYSVEAGGTLPVFGSERQDCRGSNIQPNQRRRKQCLSYSNSYDNNEDDEDDDDDDYIDTDSLGDWRNFRRSLAMGSGGDDGDDGTSIANSSTTVMSASSEREVTENEKLLEIKYMKTIRKLGVR